MSEDYERFLQSINMDEMEVSQMMAALPDPELPEDDTIYPIFSKIQGIGLASVESYHNGAKVLDLIKSGKRQVGARYINHSDKPNLRAVIHGDSMIAVATEIIWRGKELTMDYSHNMQKSMEYMAQVGL